MSDYTIRAKVQALDTVVKTFSEQLRAYTDAMENEITSLTNAVTALEGGWSGEYYDSFKKTMLTKVSKIRIETEAGKDLSRELNETAAELKEMLRLLESSGE